MKTNLELYKTFYYVAKNGNITQAANELMISQPSLEGNAKVIDDARDLTSLNNMEKGTINIGAGNTIMQRYLMPFIKEFHEIYPNINVKVNTLVTGELIKKAQVGLIDIVFTHLPNNIPDNFDIVKIKKLHDIFVVNKDSEYKDIKINKKDLETLPLVLLPLGASNRKNFDKFCLSNNIVIKPLMEIGNDLIVEECAESGLGVGLVVKEYVQNKLDNKKLFELNTTFKLEEKDLVCIIDQNRKNNIIIKNFINLLK